MRPQELMTKLTQYEDAETAIAVYRECNHMIGEYEAVKKAALGLAESELVVTGEARRSTPAGSCGWTQPKPARRLDQDAWKQALDRDTRLAARVATLTTQAALAQQELEQLQTAYVVEEPGQRRFYIR